MPTPSIENPADTEVGSEGSRQESKPWTCQYCQKRFHRLEHVQRHEMTHTIEKPIRCFCGRIFNRRDLLVRHENFVHFNKPNKHSNQPNKNLMRTAPQTSISHVSVHTIPVPNLINPDPLQNTSFQNQISNQIGQIPLNPPATSSRTSGRSLNLLSDAANDASGSQLLASPIPDMAQVPGAELRINGQHSLHFDNRINEDSAMRNFCFGTAGLAGGLGDSNLFLDARGLSSHNPLPTIDAELSSFLSSRYLSAQNPNGQTENHLQVQDGQEENNSFSRFASRPSPLQPEARDGSEYQTRPSEDFRRNGPAWEISAQDHRIIGSKLDSFVNVLQKGFTLPSRHTLSMFWEGYLNDFQDHLSFLHIPTLSAVGSAPELVLAIAAVGAQYRFEGSIGNGLWYAAKAIAMEQVRRRNSQQVLEMLSPPSTNNPESGAPILIFKPRQVDPDTRTESCQKSANESDTNLEEQYSNTPQAQLETLQALLLLTEMGTWGPRALLREGLCLRSLLALLTRELGLDNTERLDEDISWQDWIQLEGEKRTKLMVFCFFGLQCVAYDMPPLILSSEVKMLLPCSVKEWEAESGRQWREARRVTPYTEITFHDALGRLMHKSPPQESSPPVSSMGNYVLIHALIQQIFFIRQTSTTSTLGTANNSLRLEDIDNLTFALRQWHSEWKRRPECSIYPSNPNIPVDLNSTALLRLAYTRLQSDLGPCRRLESRDPLRVAAAFKNSPPLVRSASLSNAVLQSVYTLSIPVKISIANVVLRPTFSWSMQCSLCNLESAILLSKWLEIISFAPQYLTKDERNHLNMVRSMLDMTKFAVSFAAQDGIDEGTRIKELGIAVVRLWASAFRRTHTFNVIQLIGSSLEIYALLLEQGDGW